MTEHCYCGIDVAKDRLDVMVLPDRKSFSVDNNAAGYSELVKRLRGLAIAAIGIEPVLRACSLAGALHGGTR